MTKWEMTTKVVDIISTSIPSPWMIWDNKDPKTGRTDWDVIKELSASGWEVVSVTPITISTGNTKYLLYTFKRPLLET